LMVMDTTTSFLGSEFDAQQRDPLVLGAKAAHDNDPDRSVNSLSPTSRSKLAHYGAAVCALMHIG
jgi:hypothetical protein